MYQRVKDKKKYHLPVYSKRIKKKINKNPNSYAELMVRDLSSLYKVFSSKLLQ